MGEDESFSIPGRPVRKRLQGLPRFVVTRGGEYCFMPSITALKWLSELES
ncbi:MAG: peroxidase, partial [Acidobacteria bacterium]